MKKIFYSMLMLAMAAMTFTSCEDVPMPYGWPESEQKPEEKPVDPAGAGTVDNPYNVSATLQLIESLGDATSDVIYTKGFISQIDEIDAENYGNATFYISDVKGSTTNQLEVYRAKSLGNKKFTSTEEIHVGDEVVICGQVVNFRGSTPEFTQGAYIYSLNGNGGGSTPSGEAKGSGTQADPYNPAGAAEAVKNLTWTSNDNYETTGEVYVKGKISRIADNGTFTDGGTYGNASFYISENGSQEGEFYCFRILYLGNKKFVSGQTDIKVGDEVIVCGQLTNYRGNTPETVAGKAYLYSLNGKTEGGDSPGPGPQPSGKNLLTNGDFETWENGLPVGWKSESTASNADLKQSTVAHGGSYSVGVGFSDSQNKRLASKEITLKPGSYTFSFFARSTTSEKAQVRPGHVPVENGKVGSYAYDSYASLSNSGWTEVSCTFELSATTTVCLVVMNPKSSDYATAQEVLIDDASLTTSNGGLADGSDPGTGTDPAEVKAITVAEFLEAPESNDVWYQLTGTVKNLKDSDQYGNFDLEDSTGSVYVYGVLSEKGGAKKQFQTLASEKGIKNGSILTIIGNRGSYNGKIEVVNAYFVSVSN